MKAVIRMRRLMTTTAQVIIMTIDNNDILHPFKLKISDNLYDKLLYNFKRDLLVEIESGTITKFFKIMPSTDVVVQTLNRIELIQRIIGESILKKDFIISYTRQTRCSDRTARRHLKGAITMGVVSQLDAKTLCQGVHTKPRHEEQVGQTDTKKKWH